MKVTVTEKKEQSENYPCLKKTDDGMVVLFTSEGTGIG